MPNPVIRWYDDDDVAESGELQFLDAVGGVATAAQEKHVWNDKDGTAGSDPATEVEFWALSRDVGETEYSLDDEAARDGWLEMRLIASAGTGIVDQTTAWTPLGKAKKLYANDIPSECTRHAEFRMVAPASAGTVSKEFLVRCRVARADTPIEMGHYEFSRRGIATGLGDSEFTEILSGFDLTESGTPDEFVNVSLGRAVGAGVPWIKLAHQIEFTNLDSASAALASGESYYATISAGAGPDLTVTKSVKGTYPLAVSDRPEVPAGERLVGYVQVKYGLVIEQAEIDQDDRLFGCFGYVANGLVVTIHRGLALVDNRVVRFTGAAWTGTLDASDTTYVHLNADGTLTPDLTGEPLGRSEMIWEFTTDGSGITAAVDRRRWLGGQVMVIQLEKAGTLAAGNKFYGMLASPQRAYLRPIGGIAVGLGNIGGTSGSTKVEIDKRPAGGSFTTLFTSSGTDDQRPDIAYNATDPVDTDAAPEVLVFEPWSQFEAEIISVPGTASADITVALVVELQ